MLILPLLAGCISPGNSLETSPEAVRSLTCHLASLTPSVNPSEAQTLASTAYDYSRELAARYRVVRPPVFHNLLVNTGLKERGLCYHWAEDLKARLDQHDFQTLDLYRGISRAGSWREHSSVVATGRGQPFNKGIVLDPWKRSGKLSWNYVSAESTRWHRAAPGPPGTPKSLADSR